MRHDHRGRLAALAGLALAAACGAGDAAPVRRTNSRPATMEHGVEIGAHVSAAAVRCQDGRNRIVAPARGAQLVTFATPHDCSSCAPHLSGLDSLAARRQFPVEDLVVLWTPGRESGEAYLASHGHGVRTTCIDTAGTLWDRHDVSHTPFTVLLVDGQVRYINDRMLDDTTFQRALLDDVHYTLSRE